MQFTAQQIATMIQGKLEGNPDASVSKVARIEDAAENALSFVANPKYEEFLYTSRASVIIINDTLELTQPLSATLIRVTDAYASFALLLETYQKIMAGSQKTGVEEQAYVAPTAQLGEQVYIGAFSYISDNARIGNNVRIFPGCYIGPNTVIGDNTTLFAGVKIYDNCEVGCHVVIHAGTVLGSDGFGFAPLSDQTYKKIPQIGNVVVEDHVEIGANAAIDRATMGSTIIHRGVKLDNLVHIAHNVEIGEHTAIAAQSGISGSTKVGRNCVMGGQAGLVGHIQLADGTKINAQSGVTKSVTVPNSALNGSPAFDYKSTLKSQAIFRNLPDMQQRIYKLEEMVQELTALLTPQHVEFKK
jgi:UDP-3-O-[3-hydroxymyristoyl] glucosamine N-acyltransferase